MHTAEQRAKDLIRSRILAWVRADVAYRDKLHAQMSDEWTQLTGALSHLRDWARQRLTATVQAGGSVGDAEG